MYVSYGIAATTGFRLFSSFEEGISTDALLGFLVFTTNSYNDYTLTDSTTPFLHGYASRISCCCFTLDFPLFQALSSSLTVSNLSLEIFICNSLMIDTNFQVTWCYSDFKYL